MIFLRSPHGKNIDCGVNFLTDIKGLCARLINAGVDSDRILLDEPMSRHTTFRVGGPADMMLCARSGSEIALVLKLAADEGIPAYIVGNGSNLLVRDGGIDGIVIQIGAQMSGITIEDTHVYVQAGCLMSRVSAECARAGLTGFEALGGIPGTVGGAAAMNAGAYGSEFKDVLVSATVLDGNDVLTLTLDDMQMGYRTSRVLRDGMTVTGVELALSHDDTANIRARMDDFTARRRAKQPLNLPSAGSTFKRPEGYFAGALIEECGLKGVRVGGAQVSPMHAGFIVNVDGATAQDILDLIYVVRSKVHMAHGVWLEPEVRILGRQKRAGGD